MVERPLVFIDYIFCFLEFDPLYRLSRCPHSHVFQSVNKPCRQAFHQHGALVYLNHAVINTYVRCDMTRCSFRLQTRQKLISVTVLLLSLLGLVFQTAATADELGCNNTHVQLSGSGTSIAVSPNHIDDTENVQCALDVAASMGIPTVKLQADTYRISSIQVENFKGTFEGRTRTSTIIEVLDGAIGCVRMQNDGLLSAAIKFINGEPRVRFMTINAHRPCLNAGRQLSTILHFTGGSVMAADCDNDVIFAAVDRISVNGTSNETGPWAAIEVAPEGRQLGGCKDTLLGTFKLNRSYIENTHAGVVTNMKSGAQVDINFNEFRGNLQAVNIFDSNQNTTITSNKIFGDNSETASYYGIYLINYSVNPPKSTRVVVHNNEFNISSTFARTNYAVYVKSSIDSGAVDVPNISTIISNNRFNLSGTRVYGVLGKDVSNGHVSANRFSGSGRRAIYLNGGKPLSGWTITANNGFADFVSDYGEDIRFYTNTNQCIVGPGQEASVDDLGTDNIILPQ